MRDLILDPDTTPQDDDFMVRGIPPDELEVLLSRRGRVALVGKSFGVYRFIPDGGETAVDIVYPRRERSTGTGHRDFDVHWDWRIPVEDDLRRRDFTINAIAEDVRSGKRVDPTGGEADLSAGVIRMIFPEAFVEDPLRVLRGIRFAAQLGFELDGDTRRQMESAAGLLATLSAERVQEELTKILVRCQAPSVAFSLASGLGALAVILPELERCVGVEQNEYHPDDVFVHSVRSCDCAPRDNLAVRWAALMHDVGKVDARTTLTDERGERVVFYGHEAVSAQLTRATLERLRYKGTLVDRCTHLVRHHMFNYVSDWRDATVRRFMRSIGEAYLDDLFALREADCRSRDLLDELARLTELRRRVRDEQAARHTVTVSALAIDGADVMRVLGIGPGPEVGAVLDELLERVLDEPALNDRQGLLDMLGARRERDRGE